MRRTSVLLLASVVVVAACSDSTVSFDPQPDNPIAEVFGLPTPAKTLASLDAAFAEIAGKVDGFGGLYFDERGIPNVYMSVGDQPIDPGMLAAQLNIRLRELGLEGNISAAELVVRPGDYDFGQLSRFHREVVPVLGVPGVVFTDADETMNRIVIGVEAGTSAEAIAEAIHAAGVPLEAVVVVETEPIVSVQEAATLNPAVEATNIGGLPTLRDQIRPIAGGLQIWRFIPPGSASLCTLGFNASAPGFSQGMLMFTNSHCTEVRGQVTGTQYNQKQLAFPLETVAVEVADPPFFTSADDPVCPAGRRCRWSDAAAAEYVVPNEDIAAARAMAPFPGTLVVPASLRTFRIAEEATSRPMIGQALMKVGRTSGLTGAAVIATCQNANTAPDITMLCQERVAIDAIGGDSGSPVLEAIDGRGFMDVTPNQRVRLHGLLWGGSANTFVYSSMLNIRMDFPGPWVVTH